MNNAHPFKEKKYTLLLFVTGMSRGSVNAIENIKNICETYLKNNYSLEVIDIYKNPGAVEKYNIIACPTLIKKLPIPFKRLIGDLSDTDKVIEGLGIKNLIE
jgi:circadian clock protein KaiB